MTSIVTEIVYVDYGVNDEYGYFGKVVARSKVRGWTEAEVEVEIAEMRAILGNHVSAVRCEELASI